MTVTKDDLLRDWAAQDFPLLTAPTLHAAKTWLVYNDEILPPHFGSYARHYASPANHGQALRGYRGILLVIYFGWRPEYARSGSPNHKVSQAVAMWLSVGNSVVEVELP